MLAIFYKEFVKFKLVYLLFCVVILAFLAWFYAEMTALASSNSNKDIVFNIVYIRNIDFFYIDVLNITFATIVAIVSFFKERNMGRFRLGLHLPCSNAWVLCVMLAVPLFSIAVVLLVEILSYFFILSKILPFEITAEILRFLVLNAIFSLSIFIAISALILQPNMLKDAFYLFIIIIATYIYFMINPAPKFAPAYFLNKNLHFYIAIFALYAIFSFIISFCDYKKGYVK